MSVTISDLMTTSVITTTPRMTIDRVRQLIGRNRIGAVPVVNEDDEPVGIVSTIDLVGEGIRGTSQVRSIMTEPVFTVPQYNDAATAARIMRKRRVHHLVVTHEKKIVGVISAFDLLRLVEDRRFVLKNPPPEKKIRRNKRY